ncbi:Lysosomal aspartic protease [Clonorchis sinensis]|uniref:Lysosomal aspartic protease n=1 Tax=Clonorchis sinensis TaxID=79923 RepID=A0A419PXN2_CLOSI|nr:Lysosomal aspartic protease [Clonorchis sinensis]
MRINSNEMSGQCSESHCIPGAQYLCTITIEQTVFHMLLDTGSTSIWVPSDRVDRRLWVNKNVLNTAQATSLLVGRDIFHQQYAAGGVGGMKATVHMNFGGMLIRNVPFGLVMGGDENVYCHPFDGIIGLGRRPIFPENTNPFFHFVNQQGLMSRRFGFYFQDNGGSFLMGDNLERLISGPVTYIHVAEGPYWKTRVDWIFISKTGFRTEDHTIFDTGSNGIDLPGDIHMMINKVLGIWRIMQDDYVFDCGMLPFLPPIAFQIQGKRFQIMPRQYTKKTTNGKGTMCCTRFRNTTFNSPVGIVLGMSFLHSFQLIFDDHLGRVGFFARPGRSVIF